MAVLPVASRGSRYLRVRCGGRCELLTVAWETRKLRELAGRFHREKELEWAHLDWGSGDRAGRGQLFYVLHQLPGAARLSMGEFADDRTRPLAARRGSGSGVPAAADLSREDFRQRAGRIGGGVRRPILLADFLRSEDAARWARSAAGRAIRAGLHASGFEK